MGIDPAGSVSQNTFLSLSEESRSFQQQECCSHGRHSSTGSELGEGCALSLQGWEERHNSSPEGVQGRVIPLHPSTGSPRNCHRLIDI